MGLVYALIDPRTNCVHYIGKSVNPKSRLAVHLCDDGNSPKALWIKELLSIGDKPILEIMDDDDECFWIASLRAAGALLTNVGDGDNSPDYHHTDAARRKLSEAHKGRLITSAQREKMSRTTFKPGVPKDPALIAKAWATRKARGRVS